MEPAMEPAMEPSGPSSGISTGREDAEEAERGVRPCGWGNGWVGAEVEVGVDKGGWLRLQ